jgi:hypothetical protein
MRTGIITRLGIGEYEVTFDDQLHPGYGIVESMQMEKYHAEPQLPRREKAGSHAI